MTNKMKSEGTNKFKRYPQQLGRSWEVFVQYRNPSELCLLSARDTSATLSTICTGSIGNFIGHLGRNLPQLHQPSAPEQSGSMPTFCHYVIKLSTNLACYLHRNPPNLMSHPEPSRTLSAPHRLKPHHLHRNPPELHQPSAPEPSRTSSNFIDQTSSAICTRTLRNLISHLHRNPPQPCLLSAPEPYGTSWNL